MRRGEIWMVDFGPPTGPEQAGVRRAIILQDDAITSIVPTVIVLPLTTNLRRLQLSWTVRIEAGEGGLPRESVALCHQVQVKAKSRLISKVGELSDDLIAKIERCLRDAIGL